jgi:hypothetical protein
MISLFKERKNNLLLGVLVLSLFAKLFIDGFVEINKFPAYMTGVSLHKHFATYANVDDIEMAGVACNVLLGKGFVTDKSFDRPKFRTESEWPTAFRPKLNVLVHVIGLKMYAVFNPDFDIKQGVPEMYFERFSEFIFILKNILFIASLFYFYRLAALFLSTTGALISTILYCVYPSIILYVGMINIFECIIMPCLVIITSIHLYNRRFNKRFSFGQILFFTLAIPAICFLKMQVCLIMILFYAVAFLDALYNRPFKKQYLWAYMPANFLIGLFVIYIATVNHAVFGRYIISTQSSINLWHGHNAFARGSWNPAIWQQKQAELQPMLQKDSALLAQDEYTETQVYRNEAMAWIKSHPKQEVILCFRKAAIYFLPNNSNNWKINPLTLLVHVCFFGFVMLFALRRIKGIEFYYLLSPVVAIFAVNIMFFVEYRWRYLADPFMLLLACIFVNYLVERRNRTRPGAL